MNLWIAFILENDADIILVMIQKRRKAHVDAKLWSEDERANESRSQNIPSALFARGAYAFVGRK